MHEDLCNHELSITFQEGTLASRANALGSRERDLADKKKRLAEKELQELAATCKKVEELQVVWAVEVQKV
jgi:hypothetical protein